MARQPTNARQPTHDRRPYQRRSGYGAWIALAVAAVLVVVAIVVVRKQEASRPPPNQAPEVNPERERLLKLRAAEERERQHQHNIQVLRQKLKRLDRQIASTQELLKDEYSWDRERDLAKAKELAAERAQVIEELARLGEEP